MDETARVVDRVGRAFASKRPLALERDCTRPYLQPDEEMWAELLVAVSSSIESAGSIIDAAFGPRESAPFWWESDTITVEVPA